MCVRITFNILRSLCILAIATVCILVYSVYIYTATQARNFSPSYKCENLRCHAVASMCSNVENGLVFVMCSVYYKTKTKKFEGTQLKHESDMLSFMIIFTSNSSYV